MIASSHLEIPPMFRPGATISFKPSENTDILTFTIIRPFNPFTKSITLLVRCPEVGEMDVILKIYDGRFRSERTVLTRCPPWSLAAEVAASSLNLRNFDRGPGAEPFGEDLEPDDLAGLARRAMAWEAYHHAYALESYDSEVESYSRLSKFQDSGAIPRLLYSGTLIPPDERAFQIPVIIIEYIPDALPLGSDALTYPNVLTDELCATFLHVLDEFLKYGVNHGDINFNNVLFAPAKQPTRVVIIDFGESALRDADETDLEWREFVRSSTDSRHARFLLTKYKGVPADKLPVNPWQHLK